MSLVQQLTTPEGLTLVSTILGLVGLGKVRDKAAAKVKRLADLAERLLARAQQEPELAALVKGDPDAALELAIQRVADAAGIKVDAKVIRRAVGELVLRQVLEDGRRQLDGLREDFARWERIRTGEERPAMLPKTWRDR